MLQSAALPDLSPLPAVRSWAIWLPLPVSKKNSRRAGGAPSWAYREWEGRAYHAAFPQARPEFPLLSARVTIVLDPRASRRDLDNSLASVLDFFVLLEVLADDSLSILREVRGVVRRLDPPEPERAADSCLVLVEELPNE